METGERNELLLEDAPRSDTLPWIGTLLWLRQRFWPKNRMEWVVAILFGLWVHGKVSGGLYTFRGFLFLIEVGLIYAFVLFFVPLAWRWRVRTAPLAAKRVLVFALFYGFIALLGNATELLSIRSLFDVVFLTGSMPYTGAHFAGILLGIRANMEVGLVERVRDFLSRFGSRVLRAPQESETTRRGRALIFYDQAQQLAKALPGEERLHWGGLQLPRYVADNHFLIMGSSGSGKTLSLRLLMQSVLPSIAKPEGATPSRALIYDAKRDIHSVLAGMELSTEIHSLNPFDRRGSAWDIAKDVSEGTVCHQLAALLFPSESGGSSNQFFVEAARDLFGGVVQAFTLLSGEAWTLRDVVLTFRNRHLAKTIVGACPQTEYLVDKWLREGRRNDDVDATVQSKLKPLTFVAAAWDQAQTKISLSDWLAGESILLLGSSPNAEEVMRAVNGMLFARLANLLLEPGEKEAQERGKTWIFIDELRRAGRLTELPDLLVEGRSKGAAIVLGFQDVEGLYAVYSKELAQEIIGACGNKVFLNTNDYATAEYVSKHFGDEEIDKLKVSQSVGHNSQSGSGGGSAGSNSSVSTHVETTTRPVVPVGEILKLGRPNHRLEVGFEGYCDTQAIGSPYKMAMRHDELARQLKRPDPKTKDQLRRREKDLRPWDEADLERLALTDFEADLLRPPTSTELGAPEENILQGMRP